jgi:hypothetical protein
MLHRLRRAMVNQARGKLQGTVEADETFIGGPVEDLHGRGVTAAESKTLVLGAVEVLRWRDEKGRWRQRAGRLRLAPAPQAGEQSIGHPRRTGADAAPDLPAGVHFGTRKPGLGIGFKHRERVGNRREGDVRGLGVSWLREHGLGFGFILNGFHGNSSLSWLRPRPRQCLEAGDHVEQFLVKSRLP